MAVVKGKDDFDKMPTIGATWPIVPAGGTVGQVLTKDAATDYDYSWQDASTVAGLDDLTDVTITSPTTDQILLYSGGQWINADHPTGAASTTLSAWTLDSGDLYYADFNHALNTTEVAVLLYDSVTLKKVEAEDIRITDANNVRVWVRGNSESIVCNVVTGQGPRGPQGPAGPDADKPYRVGHTWAISGEIAVASGDDDFIIPFSVSLATGQTLQVVKARYSINSGTNCNVKIQKNGIDLTGFTNLTVTTTPASVTPTAQSLAEDDELALVVNSVSGTPKNLSFTLFLEYTN